MKFVSLIAFSLFAACAFIQPLAADDYSLESVESLPKDLPKEISSALSGKGTQLVGPDGAVCDLWLVKSVVSKEGFKPDLRVKYPMPVGSLVGVLEVKDGPEFTDFRDQVILPGLYTMRYGQQPQDGNHVGTSELRDFLLALPIQDDTSSETLEDEDELQEISAEAAGSAHPAIFALLPPEKQDEKATLTHEDNHDFWILQTNAGEETPIPLRLVVIGIGEE
ncbi:MAG: hypothetical protein KDA86_25725 [Planctomycetaceae bacterium]|nr:hypothetical protein [Planctomycetaceae bacterium]